MAVLEVRDLHKQFGNRSVWRKQSASRAQAVDGVSFDIERGTTLALVGESGAGKSTVGRLVLRLTEADAGGITFDGVDVRKLSARDLRRSRARMQMIFQDPYTSLNPRMSILSAVGEPLQLHTTLDRAGTRRKAGDLLDRVGIRSDQFDRYPHELSGGQLQRVAVARAISTRPDFIVCDEPVAALDVSIRAQIINLLQELQDELGVSYLFISHDLSLVRANADHVAVMRRGRIVEYAETEQLFDRPESEYTRLLLNSIPSLDIDHPNLGIVKHDSPAVEPYLLKQL
jgi:peptide/nickel transport system ATP-binding protein/oligopeptide transport system ATP-binding protein